MAALLIMLILTSCAVQNGGSSSVQSEGESMPGVTAEFEKMNFTAEDIALYEEILANQSEWVAKSLQLSNGAIPMYDRPAEGIEHKNKVVPYFSCFTALGLLETDGNQETVKKYINWHFAHINTSADVNGVVGTIYDYYIENKDLSEEPTDDYDSTDSYGALFLTLLRRYAEVTSDNALLTDNRDKIDLAAEAMMSTELNGLTWAKPTYKVKYLMDNAEVIKGLEDAVWIYKNILNNSEKQSLYQEKYDLVLSTLEDNLWDAQKEKYYLGKQPAAVMPTDLSIFYPDAVCQLYPAVWGVINPDSERAVMLYNRFAEQFPNWTKGDFSASFPWAMLAYCAAYMGDYKRADEYVKYMKTEYIDNNNQSPWYSMESGCMMMAAGLLLKAATN